MIIHRLNGCWDWVTQYPSVTLSLGHLRPVPKDGDWMEVEGVPNRYWELSYEHDTCWWRATPLSRTVVAVGGLIK